MPLRRPLGPGGPFRNHAGLAFVPRGRCPAPRAAFRGRIDVAVDLVAGPSWAGLLDVLRRGGRYAAAGAIAGPLVELDVRTLYLKDLTLFGCTFQEDAVFANLVSYIERGEIRPPVAATFPLSEIGRAQEAFLAKGFTGKLVLIPPE